jgi:predicted RNA-binding Zn-ribbon protein involved in translation (DUF1610 family)
VNDTSRQVVLVCEECGERMVLDAPISAWRQEGSNFTCECGKILTPADRLETPAADGERRS